jgi:hypothetical protein
MHWIKTRISETLTGASLQKKQRQFLWMLIVINILIESVFYFKNDMLSSYSFYSIGLIGLLILILVLIPKIAKWPLFIWLCFGLVLSEITSFIIFGVLYFFIFFPIRLIRGDKTSKGGWIKPAERTTMKDQF